MHPPLTIPINNLIWANRQNRENPKTHINQKKQRKKTKNKNKAKGQTKIKTTRSGNPRSITIKKSPQRMTQSLNQILKNAKFAGVCG